jgi:hypothetical protein
LRNLSATLNLCVYIHLFLSYGDAVSIQLLKKFLLLKEPEFQALYSILSHFKSVYFLLPSVPMNLPPEIPIPLN